MAKRTARLLRAPAHASDARRVFLDLGEPEREARVLAALVECEPPLIESIAKYTGYSAPAVYQALSELQDRGWLDSEPVPSPRRGRNPLAYRIKASKTALRRYYSQWHQERVGKLERLVA